MLLFHPSDTFLFDESLSESLILQRNKKTRQKKPRYLSLARRWPAVPGCRWAERLTARGRNAQKHQTCGSFEHFVKENVSWFSPEVHVSIEVMETKHMKLLSSSTDVFYFKDVHKNTFLQSEVQERFWHS